MHLMQVVLARDESLLVGDWFEARIKSEAESYPARRFAASGYLSRTLKRAHNGRNNHE
jgi:hypothetical protein